MTAGFLVHIIVVLLITVLFLSRTSHSFIGESWYTVAQLHSEDLAPVLENVSMMRDNQVESWLSAYQMKKDTVTLVGGGKVDGIEGKEQAHVIRRRVGRSRL